MAKTKQEVSGSAKGRDEAVGRLQRTPNVGPKMASALIRLGVSSLEDAIGRDPDEMHHELCAIDVKRHDPCVRDIFATVVSYAEGGPARSWWEFTPGYGVAIPHRDEVWLHHSPRPGSRAVGQRKRANAFHQTATT